MNIETLLAKYPEEISELGLSARDLILNELPGVQEIPDEKANMIAYGFNNTYKDLICTIILSKKGIKIGLNKGSELKDPTGLLEGTGKVHKYVQINEPKNLQNPALKQLLHEGLKAWKIRTKKS
jgi:hypothetical protein